jgi:hypothetical protein
MRIDTNLLRNVRHVQSLLGVLLIGSFVLFVGYQIQQSTTALAESLESVHTHAPESGTSGTIALASSHMNPSYGDFVSFDARVRSAPRGSVYVVSVACFQGTTLVYQRTAQLGARFLLQDMHQQDMSWDGNAAQCSAVLLHRTQENATTHIYLLDSVSFDVTKG